MESKKGTKKIPQKRNVEVIGSAAEATEQVKKPDIQSMEVTSAETWRNDNLNIRKLLLPSGAVFLVKNVSLANMATKGIIPTPLLNQFMKVSEEKSTKKETDENILETYNSEDLSAIDTTMRKFAMLAVIKPKLVEQETSISDIDSAFIPVEDLEFEDISTIFFECMRGGSQNYKEFFRK